MTYDDRPDAAKRLEQARIARGFKTAKEACTFFGWNYETYAQHENGTRGIVRASKKYAKAFRVREGWLLTGEGEGPGSDDKSLDAQVRHILPPEEDPDDYDAFVEDVIALAKSRAERRSHKN